MPVTPTKGRPGQKVAAEKRHEVEVMARQERVFQLFIAGKSYREIQSQLTTEAEKDGRSTKGYSLGQISKDVAAALDRARTHRDGVLQNLAVVQHIRLDELFSTFMTRARGKVKDPETGERGKPCVQAGRLALGVIKETNELLGIKASVKHEITGRDGGPIHVQSSVDLSKLTTDELIAYEALLKKANA